MKTFAVIIDPNEPAVPAITVADHEAALKEAVAKEREALSQAAVDVLAERQRQKSVEGWTERHDDDHDCDELSRAAACYAVAYPEGKCPKNWPWDGSWWKPKDRRRNLVRAAALLLAQIERDDRHEPRKDAAHD